MQLDSYSNCHIYALQNLLILGIGENARKIGQRAAKIDRKKGESGRGGEAGQGRQGKEGRITINNQLTPIACCREYSTTSQLPK